MAWLKKIIMDLKTGQRILIAAAFICGITALLIGVSDNPPGIILMYFALVCLAWAWVWNWRSPREFWILLGISLVAFPVGVILHNLLYALGTLVVEITILAGLVEFLEVIFFLVAVMAVGPAALVALLGGIYTSWRGMDRLTMINRSYRRFSQTDKISKKTLRKLIKLARQSASLANIQPLKYVLVTGEEADREVFPFLGWAAYLKEWAGPEEGERPAAYIILMGDTELAKNFQYDAGIACQSITLGAAELGLGACIIGSIRRDELRESLGIPERYEILLVIALGKPAERVRLVDLDEGGDFKYWRDEKDIHYVPKRGLDELILE